jgi:cobaltochelatase CobS
MIQELIDEIQSEIASERETIVKQAIQEQLKDFVFDEKNLSPTLIALLMAKSGGDSGKSYKLPIIESKPLPKEAAEKTEEILEFLSVDTPAIVQDLKVGNNVYLYGKAGTGKTTLAKKIAQKILKQAVYIINCNQFTSPVEIRGGQTIEGYKDGALVQAWERGGILILDELPKLDPNTAGLLNEALALSADQPEKQIITKEEYDMLSKQLEEAKKVDRYLGYDIYEMNGQYIQEFHITINDGKGDLRKRGDGFCVIGTGNTDMKTTSTNYSGNNRQDYSLVDRFAGSFYEISYDSALEEKLIYEKVRKISYIIREFLSKDVQSVEFISLRTMLNFNRIYEQEMLRAIESPFAQKVIEITDEKTKVKIAGKTFVESVRSFIDSLPEQKRIDLEKTTDISRAMLMDTPEEIFIEEFKQKHDNVNPLTGKK